MPFPCISLPGFYRRALKYCFALALLSLFAPLPSCADTIVLKNGRRIEALSAVMDGDKVRYETPSGELVLPKSIVDHIEKSSVPVIPKSPSRAAGEISIAPPSAKETAADAAIALRVLRDNSIDRSYIAELEGATRSGSAEANHIAAVAHNAASEFEFMHGDIKDAMTDARTALTYGPDDSRLLTNAAYLYLQHGEYKEALDFLDRATRVAPNDPDVTKLAGWAYYGMNKLDQAVAEWKHSLELRADPEVQAALKKAQRDQQEEQNYRENESSHFVLRYNGNAEPALARDVLRTLETHFSDIESQLNFAPPEPVGVILYTQQAFQDVTRAPGWVGALNDGRIRVPVQGLTEVTPELSRVLKHELTHSFILQRTQGHAPTWIQEGVAQWMEGKRSGNSAGVLVQIYDQKSAKSLAELEGSWMRFPMDVASYSYAWSLANVEFIIHTDGMVDMERILDRIAGGESTEETLRETLHSNYDDLMQSTIDYLRKTYLH